MDDIIAALRALRDATLEEVGLARRDEGEIGGLRMQAQARIYDTAAEILMREWLRRNTTQVDRISDGPLKGEH
jgi:hypothetical protein